MSYRTILAVINEYTGSTVSARYAMALALFAKARLVLYCAHEEGGVSLQMERHLAHLFSAAEAADIAVTRIAEIGAISTLLPHRAQAEGADLVFYPLTPDERYGAALQRRTAYHLLRTVKTNLAVMRIMHLGKPHPHRILLPLGGIVSNQEELVRFIAAMAEAFHSQITLFHRHNARQQALPDDLLSLRKELHLRHLQILERSGSGSIARSIALEAVSHHNDLIVLGASERGMLRRLFYGNPAGDVMQQPPCNTILFRHSLRLP